MTEGERKKYLVYLFRACSEAGLDRNDRLELVREWFNLPLDFSTFNDLRDEQLLQLREGIRFWRMMQEMRLANGSLDVEAEIRYREIHHTETDTTSRSSGTR